MRRALLRFTGSALWVVLLASCSLTQSLDGYSDGVADAGTSASCAAGEKLCGDACRQVRDPLFGCGAPSCAPCAFANAGNAGCDTAGKCVLGACAKGFADCDGVSANGCEVDIDSSPTHCGSCGKDCGAKSGGVTGCVAGECKLVTCTAPLANCDGKLESGCAVDTSSDVAHCGACNTPCPAPAASHATYACASSTCEVAACSAPFLDCNGAPADGCECGAPHAIAKCAATGGADAGGAPDAGASTDDAGSAKGGTCLLTGACQPGFADCNGDVSTDGCEVDLLGDAANCGSCGWSCNGVGCAAGFCTPASISDGQANPGQITLDRFYAYWTNYGAGNVPGSVFSVQKDGSNPLPIAGGVADPHEQQAWGIAASDLDAHVYWTTFDKLAASHIGRQLKTGGTPTRVAFAGKARAIALDVDTNGAGFVYWATFDTNILYRLAVPAFSGTPEILAEGEPYVRGPNNIVADGDAIYWTNEGTPVAGGTTANTGSVVSMTKAGPDGGAPVFTTLVANANAPRGIALDASNVYFAESGLQTTQTGKVRRVAKVGASQTPLDLVSGLGNTRELALCKPSVAGDCAKDEWVYFSSFVDGTIQRVTKDGARVQTLATGQNHPIGVAVDDTAIFWASYGATTTANGAIMRLPKPTM